MYVPVWACSPLPVITRSKLIIETLEESVKYVESEKTSTNVIQMSF